MKKQITIYLLLIGLFLAPLTKAQDQTQNKWIQVNQDSANIIVSYDEEGRYFVEKFYLDHGAFQKKVFSKIFSQNSKRDAWLKNYLNRQSNYQSFSQVQQVEFLKEYNQDEFVNAASMSPYTVLKNQNIWVATEVWNQDWEQKYSQWVQANGDIDFLKNHGISTDCADVAYSYRWIFSFIHKLPMANRLSGSGKIFHNQVFLSQWKGLSRSSNWWEDQVFMAALDYLLENSYTHTLIDDSYPVQISQEAIVPGVHHLEIRPHSGHTMLLTKTNYFQDGDPLTFIYSDVPRTVRTLFTSGYWYTLQPLSFDKGGFLKMKWVMRDTKGNFTLLEAKKHPYYSLEQYKPEFMTGFDYFNDAIQTKLSTFYNTPAGKISRLLKRIGSVIEDRTYIVIVGFAECQKKNCQPGDETYEAWSTPSRDARVVTHLELLNQLLNQYNDSQFFLLWEELKKKEIYIKFDSDWKPILKITVGEAVDAFINKKFSSDPRDSIEKRWGL